ncbi:hypothetical protein DZB84_04695 [Bacillus sp. HNG]|uniref:UPF0738 family protein n=1 Tax=Bacillus sp. HNG TaxID=2293325 RepID=UPI000E2FC270|nr:hypothetical protein [Bacillus sp. HNG]RFB18217.1 hypothetical protein DZB84_04695 [Bacillus sp. HNG]
MQKHIEISQFNYSNGRLELKAEHTDFDTDGLSATGQMLVDSDSLAFIYKLENEQEFIYVSLPSAVWPSLKNVISEKQKVILHLEDNELELIDIIPELEYLLQNIEGNANYGDDMVELVEKTFLS